MDRSTHETKADNNEEVKEAVGTQPDFVNVEMTIDEEAFEGSIDEITTGGFVSFRYTAWLGSAPPLNPKVS